VPETEIGLSESGNQNLEILSQSAVANAPRTSEGESQPNPSSAAAPSEFTHIANVR